MKKIAITLGEPNGISPEITIKALNFVDLPLDNVVLIANNDILDFYGKNYDLSLENKYEIINIPFDISKISIGKETPDGGEFAFNTIKKACELALNNEIDAIVTAPVSKNALKMAGHNYNGQTEILEKFLAKNGQKAQMLFVCNNFSLLLLTRHIALNKVSEFIKKDLITKTIEQLDKSLRSQLNVKSPKYAVCALNPHSGENGMFGSEETDEIIPAINELKQKGLDIEGPFSADSLFAKLDRENPKYKCYIAMYHDQGLIPVKLLEGSTSVNTTIGLDILRTSPAHGTAFDIAGQNIADPESMINAINLALQ